METVAAEGRIDWIDIAKGLLIALVVLGHANGISNRYIYLFHVPLFFMLSGYTEKLEEKSLLDITINKICSLIIPFYFINYIFVILRELLQLVHLDTLYYQDPILSGTWTSILLMRWIPDLGGATWFLLTLFTSFILSKIYIMFTGKKNNILTIIIATIAMIIVYWSSSHNMDWGHNFNVTILATFYIIVGNKIRQYRLLEKIKIKWWILIIATLTYMYIFSNIIGMNIDMSMADMYIWYVDILSVFIAAILLTAWSKIIDTSKIKVLALWLGRNSLAILALHFLAIRIMMTVLVAFKTIDKSSLINSTPPYSGYYSFIYLSISCIMVYFIVSLLARYRWFQIVYMGKLKINSYKKMPQLIKNIVIALILVTSISCFINFTPVRKLIKTVGIEFLNKDYFVFEDQYRDSWIGESSVLRYRSRSGHITLIINNSENTPNQNIRLSSAGDLLYSQKLEVGVNTINLDVIPQADSEIKIELSQTFIPEEISDSEDTRKLGAIIYCN